MPRRARAHVPGYPLHVVQRGHNRQPCFIDESGYRLYLSLLEHLHGDFGCAIHAFVLMPNHVHLLLTPDSAPGASELMRHLNLRFARIMNGKHHKTGSPWEGRFWSSVIGHADYFLRCQRYIELNPVRAALVDRPHGYRWSSYRCNAWGRASGLIQPHAEYMALGSTSKARQSAYRSLIAEGLQASDIAAIRQAAASNVPYGSEEFVASLESSFKRSMRVRPRGRPRKRPTCEM